MTIGDNGSYVIAELMKRMDPKALSRLQLGELDDLPFLAVKLPGPFGALFTTRKGGISPGPFDSLNLSPWFDDDYKAVKSNRAKVQKLITRLFVDEKQSSTNPSYQLVSPLQVHGLRVVGTAEYAAESAIQLEQGQEIQGCDGLILNGELDQGFAALLLFADCVPVILAGEVDVAVLHAGWRGVLDGVITQGARAMTGPPGVAFIGPSIGPCCFSVSKDVAKDFANRFGSQVVLDNEGGLHVDLWAAVVTELSEIGVAVHQVINPRLCTCCNKDLFFSFRGDNEVTGRQGAIVWAIL